MKNEKLSLTDEINLHYLLELMPPLFDVPEYALLPELFSTIGIDSLLALCKYAGGETVKIPTLSELSDAILALDMFYNIELLHKPYNDTTSDSVVNLYKKIKSVYDSKKDIE